MVQGQPPDLLAGGTCAWRLPPDETGPAVARSLLERTLARLGLDRDVIEDGRLAVSETATNALRHARPAPWTTAPVPLELWIWARTMPAPQLIVSVFDGVRSARPHVGGADLLDEFGKGLALLSEVTAVWGHHPSRSLLAERPTPGKTVWFALPLPATWPGRNVVVHPGAAAQCLLHVLAHRGYPGRCRSDRRGVSLLELPGLNIWMCPGHFSWQVSAERWVRHPLLDVQETAEQVVRLLESHPPRME